MKKSKLFDLTVFGIAASAVLCFSACGKDENAMSVPNINTATVTTASAAVSTTAATPSATVTTAVSVSSVTSCETSAASTAPERPVVGNALSEVQLDEIAAQQLGQLKALAIGNKRRYLELVDSKRFFAALYGKEAQVLSEQELAEKITEAEDSYYRLNILVFGDIEVREVTDLVCVPVPETSAADGILEYSMTFTAVTDTARISMEGTVIDDHGTLMSVSVAAEGIIP